MQQNTYNDIPQESNRVNRLFLNIIRTDIKSHLNKTFSLTI